MKWAALWYRRTDGHGETIGITWHLGTNTAFEVARGEPLSKL